MSKNLTDRGASPLNLSLSGLQLNHSKATKPQNVRKPPAYSNRSVSSSTSNLNLETNSKKTATDEGKSSKLAQNLNLNSSRSNYNNQVNDKKAKLPPYLRKFDEKENNQNGKKENESPAFTLLSVRSSTDEFDNSRKMNDLKPTKTAGINGLELFFGSDSKDLESNYLSKFSNGIYGGSSSEIDYQIINPVKDDNINKLQTSVDNLRKAFQNEIGNNDLGDAMIHKKLENTRKKIAALKIQTWYRKSCVSLQNRHQAEIEQLFNKKMRKKMEENLVKSSVFSKKPTSSAYKTEKSKFSYAKNLKNINSSTAKASYAVDQSENFENTNTGDLIDSLNFKNDFSNAKQSPENSPKLYNGVDRKKTTNATVESLLFNLEKIDRESEIFLNPENKNQMNANGITSEKLNSIMSFLDDAATNESNKFTPKEFNEFKYDLNAIKREIETENEKTAIARRQNSQKKVISSENTSVGDKPPQRTYSAKTRTITQVESNPNKINIAKKVAEEVNEEYTSSVPAEITSALLTLKQEVEEKKRTVALLEKALSQQRELTIRHTQEGDKEMQIRLEAQKSDYEATIQRHLNFIDQLIDDKKVLSEKCEKLVKELKDVEKTYSDRLRTAEERYKVDSQRIKDTLETAEKLRREKWIEDKTKQIKEMTVKGLEPEIQSLITKHKNELKKLKTIHDAELLQSDERAAQRYIKITEELRENYEREKEASIQRERDLCKQRYEKSLEEEEKSFLEQRRRLYAEVEEEKNRIAEQAAFQRKELDKLRKNLEENNLNAIETIRKEYVEAQSELEKKHQLEIRNLKEKLDIEKQSWEQNYLKKQDNWSIQKEREIKDQLKRERDKEIEALIMRLETEATLAREEADRTAENRIKRVRDKYESELKEVEKTERETMERYNNIKAKYNELEGDNERMKVVVRQREKDLEGIKKLTDVLQEERNRLADVIRQEFSDRIVFTEEENKRIKLEMAENKSRHQYELDKKKDEFEKVQKEKTDELNTVHEKIKQVVSKKDEAFNQLKSQYEAACKRADHLEGLLEQQRTLMLKKQSKE